MINRIKKILGIGPATNFSEIAKEGAIVLDVRSPGEYTCGHIRGSINIPVDQLRHSLSSLKDKNKPIITCCASGMRSAAAKKILTSGGCTQVYNGGGWNSLQNKINQHDGR